MVPPSRELTRGHTHRDVTDTRPLSSLQSLKVYEGQNAYRKGSFNTSQRSHIGLGKNLNHENGWVYDERHTRSLPELNVLSLHT